VTQPVERYQDPETAKDLHAAVQARRELGADLEDHVVDAFLARIEQRVQAQVAQQVTASSKPAKQRTTYNPTEIVGASFGIAIPLCGVAGVFAGALGVLAVIALVLLVNLALYFDPRDRF
jgi:hypothetical protein